MSDDLQRAGACFDQGAFDEAERLCRAALARAPTDPGAHVLLGRISQSKGQGEAAQNAFRTAAQADATYVEAWVQWAKLLKNHGHLEQAEACLRLALKHVPDAFAVHNDLGIILTLRENLDGADTHLQRALEISPGSVVALCNLGVVHKLRGKIDEAIAVYRQAIAVDSRIPEVHNNLGDVLRARDPIAARAAFETAVTLRPGYVEALDNLGVAYFIEGRLAAALEAFERALAIQPDCHAAMNHRATSLFMLGRLEDAWKAYRHRFEAAGFKRTPHGRFAFPIWNGEPLAGKRILVWTELGLGEEILQAGMFHDAVAAAAGLTVECSPRLMGLFARSFPAVTFIPRTEPTRKSTAQVAADYQIAGGDLGAAFRRDFSAFPRHAGYLAADPLQVEALKRKYKASGKLVVGLSWASRKSPLGEDKTLALSTFAPILRQSGIVFINLQYDSQPREVAEVSAALGVEIVTDESVDPAGDMDAVAAQVAAMDLVIAVSNTAVHVAGALNVPVWNIVPGHSVSGMWHWFYDRADSPWYPAMKLYRRMQADDQPLMARIAEDLGDFRDCHGVREGA